MNTSLKAIAAVVLLSTSLDAAAYLDPGTGSLILQGLIAGVAVAGFTIRTYWYKLRSMFGKPQPGNLLDDENEGLTMDEEQK